MALGELLLMIYFLLMDQSRKQTSRTVNANDNLVCQVFRSLEDVCSTDIARNPFIPFGGRSAVKCDESKFNHKTKVSSILRIHLQYRVFFKQSKLQEALLSLDYSGYLKGRPSLGLGLLSIYLSTIIYSGVMHAIETCTKTRRRTT